MPIMRPLIQEVTTDYSRAKRLLNRARHPAFVGREQFSKSATNGGALIWLLDGEDVAVSLVDTRRSVLIALSVARPGEGIGSRIVEYVRPNWARVVGEKVTWFEARGYARVGQPTKGRTLWTQIMMRRGLSALGERVRLLNATERRLGRG